MHINHLGNLCTDLPIGHFLKAPPIKSLFIFGDRKDANFKAKTKSKMWFMQITIIGNNK